MTAVKVSEARQRVISALIREEEQSNSSHHDDARRRETWQQGVATKLLDLAPESRRAYRHELDRWQAFLAVAGVEPADALLSHARAYSRYLDERDGLAPASIARALAALSGIYRDVELQHPGLTAGNPFTATRRPQVSAVSSTPSLTIDEARTFVAAAQTVGPRAYSLALLLLSTGLRISEALAANSRDLATSSGQTMLKITRKGNRTAHIGLPDPVTAAIAAYSKTRPRGSGRPIVRRIGPHPIRLGPLFTGRRGSRLTYSEARREIQRICRAADWDADAVTAHALHHAFATTAVGTCAIPVRQVRHALGHTSSTTTERYLQNDQFSASVNTAVAAELLADGAMLAE